MEFGKLCSNAGIRGINECFVLSSYFRWAESCRLSLANEGVVAHRERAAGRKSGVAGSNPACETPYLRHHLSIVICLGHSSCGRGEKTSANRVAWSRGKAGPTRSSTAIEHPDSTSGRCGFDAHRERQFRRAVEFGLSGKAGNRERVRIPHHRATDGFPTRSLSVALFQPSTINHFSTGRRIGLSPR